MLTVHPRAYPATSDAQLSDVDARTRVHRAFALDTARHLAVAGRYARFLALPDRWSSWWLGAVPAGLRLIRRHDIRAIWSTYPVATALLIGLTLHRLTGLPWITDLRDPLTDVDWPEDPLVHRAHRWLEQQIMKRVRYCVFTTPGSVSRFAHRFPGMDRDRLRCIPNGYDEEAFQRAEHACRETPRRATVTLLHSGVIYPAGRDPTALFDALAQLTEAGALAPGDLRVVLRATGHDADFQPLLASRALEAFVELAPAIPYADALREMLAVDALLVLQDSSFNEQVPAKIYEYLRAEKPILALTDAAGDTASVLRECGVETIVPLEDPVAIAQALEQLVAAIRQGTARRPDPAAVTRYARRHQTAAFAALLERCD